MILRAFRSPNRGLSIGGLAALLVSGCASSNPLHTPNEDAAPSVIARPMGSAGSGRGQSAQLDKSVELAFYRPVAIRQIYEELARVYFGGRFEGSLDPEISFAGEISWRPLRQVLDHLCAESGCAWRVEGDPATLILLPQAVLR